MATIAVVVTYEEPVKSSLWCALKARVAWFDDTATPMGFEHETLEVEILDTDNATQVNAKVKAAVVDFLVTRGLSVDGKILVPQLTKV